MIEKAYTVTRTPSALVHEVDEWATVVEEQSAPAAGITCDVCGRLVLADTKLFMYWYWDLLGPEAVCPECKPAHDEADRAHGYGTKEE